MTAATLAAIFSSASSQVHRLHRSVGRACEGNVEPVGVVVDLGAGETLRTCESLGDRMLAVWLELDEPTVFDGGDQATGRLADSAER